MTRTFRIDGRGGSFVADEPEPVVAAVAEPDLQPEEPRERVRFLRRDRETLQRHPTPPSASEALSERLVASLGSALEKLAGKETPAPILNVHLASPDLSVSVSQPAPHVDVNVPEQPAPDVNVTVEAPEIPAPQVTVAAAVPANVEVHVPEAPAPVVNVQNDVNVEVPRPRPIRVEELDDGTRRYVPEEE